MLGRVMLALVLVALSTVVLSLAGADLAIALVTLLLVVVVASVLGVAAGTTAAIASFAVLNYEFTPPVHSFAIGRTDDLVALVVFVATGAVTGAVIARLNDLRAQSTLNAREARLRLDLVGRLVAGTEPRAVVQAAAEELSALFGLAACTIVTPTGRYAAPANGDGGAPLHLPAGVITFELSPRRRLTPGDLATIEALGVSLSATLDRIRLDREAHEYRARAELDHSRAGFLTAVTHDLRTPLAAIKASTGALLVPGSRLGSSDRHELLELAHNEVERLERMVTAVLQMARIRAGSLHPEPAALSAADVVQAVVGRLSRSAESRTIELEMDDTTPALWVDPDMIERVVSNLLENAVRHSPVDRSITVTTRCVTDSDLRDGIGPVELRFVERTKLAA